MSHTPGPLTVKVSDKWPFDIETIGADGLVKFVTRMPCNSTSDGSAKDAIECKNFKQSEREEYSAINRRAVADDVLRAAAPELLEALIWAMDSARISYTQRIKGQNEHYCDMVDKARAAIAKATGAV